MRADSGLRTAPDGHSSPSARMAERMEKTYSEVLDEHRAQRHEHFLKTAAKVFAENGIRRTSMEQLASAAAAASGA